MKTIPIKDVLIQLLPVIEQTLGIRQLRYTLDDVRLSNKQVTGLVLVTNELIANAVKHGEGLVLVNFRVLEEIATLEVCDDGPGFAENFAPSTAANTGLDLIENIVTLDLRGTTSYVTRPQGGGQVTVSFPLSSS